MKIDDNDKAEQFFILIMKQWQLVRDQRTTNRLPLTLRPEPSLTINQMSASDVTFHVRN